MGNYCSCLSKKKSDIIEFNDASSKVKLDKHDKEVIKKIALKLPHGVGYIEYEDKTKSFVKYVDINLWIKKLYKGKNIQNYIVYNDETNKIGDKHTKKGHCKGILTWNNNNISFLVHSIPNFPEKFGEGDISDINPSELIYGQSMIYIEFNFTAITLYNILNSIHSMKAHIYIEKNLPILNYLNDNRIISTKISKNITYIVKPPSLYIDIYSEYLYEKYKSKWFIETWQRGHHITNNDCENIIDIKKLKFENIGWLESQDHSKWAVCDKYFSIGDLNRMTSQFKRGGGLILCEDINVCYALKALIVS